MEFQGAREAVHFCYYVLHFPPPGLPGGCQRVFQAAGASPGVTFESREGLQCENFSSFEPQKSVFGRTSKLSWHIAEGGWNTLTPLLEFRTSGCLILGSLPLGVSL